MNQESAIVDETKEKAQKSVVFLAWGALLLTSALPNILYQGQMTQLIALIKVCGLLICLFFSLRADSFFRPLRGYLLSLIIIVVGWDLVRPSILHSALWTSWTQQAPTGVVLVTTELVRMLPLPFLLLTLLGTHIRRRELFLQRGNYATPVRLGSHKYLRLPFSWRAVAILFLIIAAIVLPFYLFVTLHPNLNLLNLLLINLPAILLAALLNASNEELQYRCFLLAHLIPTVGERQALWLTVVLFGVGHYYGQPSGVIGVLLAGIAGWIWGLSILQTKSWRLALFLHIVQDIVIFSLLILANQT